MRLEQGKYNPSLKLAVDIAEELHAGIDEISTNGNDLFYYTFMNKISRHNYEIDFLITRKNKICPLEIKSLGYKKHASMDHFCEKYAGRVLWKYLIYTKDYAKDGDVVCLPVYMMPFI